MFQKTAKKTQKADLMTTGPMATGLKIQNILEN